MKMMPMAKVSEGKSQVLNKKLKSDTLDKNSFKTEYENRQEEIKKSSDELPKDIKTDNKKSLDELPKDVKTDNKKSSENITPESKKEDVSKKIVLNSNNTEEIKGVKNSSDRDIKLIKNIKVDKKKVLNRTKGENKAKETDKDNLNQSVAASLITPGDKEVRAEKSNSKDNDIKAETGIKENSENKADSLTIDKSLSIKTPIDNRFEGALNQDKKVDKKAGSKKEESKIKVTDLRSEAKSSIEMDKKAASEVNPMNQSSEVKLENNIESSSESTIVLGTTDISAEGEGGKAQAPVLKEASTLLKQQLKDFGNNEIVKQSRFILKDNNVGEIKLILKPEALGQVKINLNLSENSLAGQIVVENNSVKEVFQENINQLSKALEEKGFDSAKLDVSLSDKRGSDSGDKRENRQYFSERLKRFDDNGQVVRIGAPTVGINLTA